MVGGKRVAQGLLTGPRLRVKLGENVLGIITLEMQRPGFGAVLLGEGVAVRVEDGVEGILRSGNERKVRDFSGTACGWVMETSALLSVCSAASCGSCVETGAALPASSGTA